MFMNTDVKRQLRRLDVLTGAALESDLQWLEGRKVSVAISVAGFALAAGEKLDQSGEDATALKGIANRALAEA